MSLPVRYGLMAGGSVIVYLLLFYFIDKVSMLHPGVYWSSLAFPIIFMGKGLLEVRRQQEGPLEWRDGLRITFAIFVVSSALYWVFYFLLFKLDPELLVLQKEVDIEMLRRSARWIGRSPDDAMIREAIEAVKQEDRSVRLWDVFFGFSRSVLGGFILSLIITAIIRRVK